MQLCCCLHLCGALCITERMHKAKMVWCVCIDIIFVQVLLETNRLICHLHSYPAAETILLRENILMHGRPKSKSVHHTSLQLLYIHIGFASSFFFLALADGLSSSTIPHKQVLAYLHQYVKYMVSSGAVLLLACSASQ